ncbi:hypothetical protein LSTR_LSTR002129 [Laodelphax striatellus]|uniref:Uncharacterized protein n=1 Tax=Laodelphax striatellus TaxID=195883 RepID=A0A482XQ10_LAOST|nr:hypothetical protein LSTR_LSTR002129 [Laodelphax striatellus]
MLSSRNAGEQKQRRSRSFHEDKKRGQSWFLSVCECVCVYSMVKGGSKNQLSKTSQPWWWLVRRGLRSILFKSSVRVETWCCAVHLRLGYLHPRNVVYENVATKLIRRC